MQLFYISGAVTNGPSLNGAFSQAILGGLNSCQILLHTLGPFAGDVAGFLQYDLMVAAGATMGRSGRISGVLAPNRMPRRRSR
jgi:hypothetical protein